MNSDENGQIERISDLEERFVKALEIGLTYGTLPESQWKMWCIDQIMRTLLKDEYEKVITDFAEITKDENSYPWSEGIEPSWMQEVEP